MSDVLTEAEIEAHLEASDRLSDAISEVFHGEEAVHCFAALATMLAAMIHVTADEGVSDEERFRHFVEMAKYELEAGRAGVVH